MADKLEQYCALCAKIDHLNGIEQSYHTDFNYQATERIIALEKRVDQLQAQVTPLVSSVFDLMSTCLALEKGIAMLEAHHVLLARAAELAAEKIETLEANTPEGLRRIAERTYES